MTHALKSPEFEPYVLISGRRKLKKVRYITMMDSNGETYQIKERQMENVHDFELSIGLSNYLSTAGRPIPYVLADNEPAYRGEMYPEVLERGYKGYPYSKRASGGLLRAATDWRDYRRYTGLAPWAVPNNGYEVSSYLKRIGFKKANPEEVANSWMQKPSKDLRQYTEDYIRSPKVLKEFVYDRVGPLSVLRMLCAYQVCVGHLCFMHR